MKHLRIAAIVVVLVACGVGSAHGQTPGTVTLHVAAVDTMPDGTTVVIVLASGAAIVVKHTDIATPPPPDVPQRREEDVLSGRRPRTPTRLPTNDETHRGAAAAVGRR